MDGIYDYIGYSGSGNYGSTFKVKRKIDNKEIAIKIIPHTDKTTEETLKRDIEPLQILSPQCDNLFIVCYYNSYKYLNTLIVEMEYINGYNMDDFIRRKSRTSEEKYYYLLLLASDISKGLKYIHSHNIIHNDIKPENIMVQYDTSIPKIIDFGLSCLPDQIIDPNESLMYCKFKGGTPFFMPLEKFTDARSYPKSDMWSLGISLYKITTGKFPMSPVKTVNDIVEKLKKRNYSKLRVSNNLLNVITNGLLKIDIGDRFSSDVVIRQINEKRLQYFRPDSLDNPLVLPPPRIKNITTGQVDYIDYINNINPGVDNI